MRKGDLTCQTIHVETRQREILLVAEPNLSELLHPEAKSLFLHHPSSSYSRWEC